METKPSHDIEGKPTNLANSILRVHGSFIKPEIFLRTIKKQEHQSLLQDY